MKKTIETLVNEINMISERFFNFNVIISSDCFIISYEAIGCPNIISQWNDVDALIEYLYEILEEEKEYADLVSAALSE